MRLAVSKTVYAEAAGNILALNYSTGALLTTYSGNGHAPDGTGVISGGKLSGDIVVNNNDGTVGLIDIKTGTETIIATGGTRGDFVSTDASNGTLWWWRRHRSPGAGEPRALRSGSRGARFTAAPLKHPAKFRLPRLTSARRATRGEIWRGPR